MIKVVKRKNIIKISGHADYRKSNDIVCAFASGVMYTTVNAISYINKDYINYYDNNDEVTITILSNDTTTKKIIDNMLKMFYTLSKDYPKNIMVKEE